MNKGDSGERARENEINLKISTIIYAVSFTFAAQFMLTVKSLPSNNLQLNIKDARLRNGSNFFFKKSHVYNSLTFKSDSSNMASSKINSF